ncbi:hypothetical protein OHB49_23585 [Streptomyces sp. NBC_01717]|uniref:hypothetical protein n=1 Tax=Streptomyces sp. NBC_01717 TaxID=2975918 RepID=UPI002E335632|nr:hypothetical protein [Streptomyces sp. NBC_01717]
MAFLDTFAQYEDSLVSAWSISDRGDIASLPQALTDLSSQVIAVRRAQTKVALEGPVEAGSAAAATLVAVKGTVEALLAEASGLPAPRQVSSRSSHRHALTVRGAFEHKARLVMDSTDHIPDTSTEVRLRS